MVSRRRCHPEEENDAGRTKESITVENPSSEVRRTPSIEFGSTMKSASDPECDEISDMNAHFSIESQGVDGVSAAVVQI